MTKIATDFASKLAVAFVAVAMVFAAYAPAAQAQSSEDLQQMINDLLAQVAQLQAGAGSGAAMSCDSFLMDLGQGTSNADVMRLQKFLNMDPDTRVAAAGMAGSAGMETMYYGPATAAAVSKFQVKYRAEILSPLGLVNPTGYFGAGSRAKANALCTENIGSGDMDDEDDMDEDTDEDEEDEDEDFVLGGNADLDTFEVDDADDVEVEEGDKDVEIGEFTVMFENGDAEISRLTIALLKDGQTNTTTNEPWEAFETISLWVDGDKIAEMDASDEDDYLDEDTGELRFSNLDLVGMEDEEMVITVGAEVQDNLDGTELGLWDLYALEMRYFDADGVAVNADGVDQLQDDFSGDVATFEVLEAGENEELNFSLGSNNPDATDIVVDETSRTNDVTIMEYTIEAEDNDIELNNLFVNIVTTGADYADVVSDIELVIDGQVFRDEAVVSTGAYSATSVRVEFDIDGDIVIDEDDEVEVEVVVDFKAQQSNYDNGDQIKAQVTSVERDLTDAEGADDVTEFSGTATGETHTLVAKGIVLPVDGVQTSTDTQGDNDQTGIFTIEFDVTAVEGDFYITDDVFTTGDTATTGVYYTVDGPGAPTSSGVLSSTGDEDTTDVFTVREGETETFTLTVTVDASATGQHRVTLTEVNYTDETDGVSGVGASYTPNPAQDFRTSYKNINAN